jgi:ABC-type transport system substrate-binding protein
MAIKWCPYLFFLGIFLASAGCSRGIEQYRIGLVQAPKTVKSWEVRDGASTLLSKQVHLGLLTHDALTGEIIGGVADSWRFYNQFKGIEFKLKKGLHFHDGREMRCLDVLESFKRAQDLAEQIALYLPKDLKFFCQSDSEFHMTSEAAMPYIFFQILASAQLAISREDGMTGLGKYKVKSFKPERVVLECHHCGDKAPRELLFEVGVEKDLIEKFKNKELDDLLFLGIYKDVRDNFEKFKTLEGSTPTSFWLNFNLKHPPFDQLEFRKDMALILKAGLVETKIFGAENIIYGLLPWGLKGEKRFSDERFQESEVIKAKKNVAAKLKSLSQGPIELSLREENRELYHWEKLIKFVNTPEELIRPHYYTTQDFFKGYYAKDFKIYFIGSNFARNDPFEVFSFFRVGDSINPSSIKEKVIDDYLLQFYQASSEEEAYKLVELADAWLLQQAIVVPLFSKKFIGVYQEDFKDISMSYLGPLMLDYSLIEKD